MANNPNSSEFTVGILGAGAMGRGIAQIIATGGMHVLLFDANDDVVEAGREFAERMIFRAGEKGTITDEEAKASVARLSVANQLSDLRNSDLVIEAVSEDLDIKRKVFLGLEEVVAEGCILATNTSSLSVAAIAAVLKYPGRFAGFHFFNPVPLMKVVEVVSGLETTSRT
ncbi:MAG: 3-hydroxyacyl-CoA dehydrogenase, partial [Flavobacteriales bacterium TMED123]